MLVGHGRAHAARKQARTQGLFTEKVERILAFTPSYLLILLGTYFWNLKCLICPFVFYM